MMMHKNLSMSWWSKWKALEDLQGWSHSQRASMWGWPTSQRPFDD